MKLSICFLLLVFIFCVAIPVPGDYTQMMKDGSKVQWIDNLFDYTIPLIAALFLFYSFLQDEKYKVNELFKFYEAKKYHRMIIFRWLTIVVTFSIGAIASHLVYFRNIAFLDLQSLWMALVKIPNIMMLCSIFIFFMMQFKNAYIGLFVMLAYYVSDFITAGGKLAFMSIGAHANNFYYQYSPTFYMINRLVLVMISVLLLLLASRKHPLFRMSGYRLLKR